MSLEKLLFRCRSLLCALPEFFRGRTEPSLRCDDADRDRLGLRYEAQTFQAVSKAVTENVRTKGDARSRFDGRKNPGHAVMFFHDVRLLFHLRKGDREDIIVFWIVFTGEANQWFGRSLGKRNGPATGKRMLPGDRNSNPIVKQLFISQDAQRTSLRGTNDQSELKPAITHAVENGLVGPIVQSDVHVWHFSLKCA